MVAKGEDGAGIEESIGDIEGGAHQPAAIDPQIEHECHRTGPIHSGDRAVLLNGRAGGEMFDANFFDPLFGIGHVVPIA